MTAETMQDVIAAAEAEPSELEQEERPGIPTDLVGVDAYLRILNRIAMERAEVLRLFEPYRQREAAMLAKLDRQASFVESAIRVYASEHREEFVRGKSKSRELPSGTVAFRKSAEKLRVVNEEEFLAVAPDELVRVKRSPDLKAIGAAMKASGLIPPGCEYVPESETISIKPADVPVIDANTSKELTP